MVAQRAAIFLLPIGRSSPGVHSLTVNGDRGVIQGSQQLFLDVADIGGLCCIQSRPRIGSCGDLVGSDLILPVLINKYFML